MLDLGTGLSFSQKRVPSRKSSPGPVPLRRLARAIPGQATSSGGSGIYVPSACWARRARPGPASVPWVHGESPGSLGRVPARELGVGCRSLSRAQRALGFHLPAHWGPSRSLMLSRAWSPCLLFY